MATSIFGAAFDKLPREMQSAISAQLRVRMLRYRMAMQRGYNGQTKVVLLGDTPGPGRPSTTGYHHTPFYSTKNSSLWINKMLIENGIDEGFLLWFNTTLADGSPLDPVHLKDLEHLNPTIICLGGNAEMWVRRNAPTSLYVKVHHPQFAKRFKSKEPYALIDEIKKAIHARAPGSERQQ